MPGSVRADERGRMGAGDMTTPDCSTCREAECPDHGQPPNMRTRTAEECLLQRGVPCEFWNRERQECRVTAYIDERFGRKLFYGNCRCLSWYEPRYDDYAVGGCPWRKLAQGQAFTVAETCHVPAGDWAEKLVGKWPGDETDEEIEEALEGLR